MTFQCIKNTLGKANNFKNQILPMWSYNINCWVGSMPAAFFSAVVSAAVKVKDKNQQAGALGATRIHTTLLLIFLHPTFPTETSRFLCPTEHVCAFLHAFVCNRYEINEYCRVVMGFGSFYSQFGICCVFAAALPAPRGDEPQPGTGSPSLCSLPPKGLSHTDCG